MVRLAAVAALALVLWGCATAEWEAQEASCPEQAVQSAAALGYTFEAYYDICIKVHRHTTSGGPDVLNPAIGIVTPFIR